MAKRKNILTIKEKIEVINVLEKEKLTAREIAKRFNIGKSQAARINKNKEAIRSAWESGVNALQKKSFVKPGGSDIDKLCFDWFSETRCQNIPISGPKIKAKAREIAAQLGLSNFSASDGWLHKWRKRHNVSSKCNTGEASHANLEDIEQLKEIEFVNPSDIMEMCQSELEEEINVDIIDPITSYDEALKHIFCLKQFAKDDYIAFQLIKNLENHFETQQLKLKQSNFKQSI